jgi:hypothetical protein
MDKKGDFYNYFYRLDRSIDFVGGFTVFLEFLNAGT